MAIAVVHSKQTPSTATAVLGIGAAVAGNILVAFISQTGSATAPKGKDNVSGETGWSVNATSAQGASANNHVWLAIKTAVGGETELNPTVGTGGAIQGISYLELSGCSETVDTIVHADNIAAAKTATSPAITTTDAGSIVLAGIGDGTQASGAIEAWSASNGATPVANGTESTRCWGASYLPGETLSAVTLTTKWTTEKVTAMLVVALKPSATEQTGKGEGALSVGARLSAVSAKIALALGSLSVGVRLTGTAGQSVRQATGSLSVGARIAGTPGQSTRTGKGALSVGVRFTGVGKKEGAEQVGKAVGSLSVGARFSPTGVGVHAGAGALSVGPRLAPTSASVRSAAGSLHVGARLTPSAAKVARGAGTLSCGARLASSYSTIRKTQGTVHVGVQLTGSHAAPGVAHRGALSVGVRLVGVGHMVIVTPQPPLGIPLTGHVSVGQTGRLSRQTGKLGTPTSGRAH